VLKKILSFGGVGGLMTILGLTLNTILLKYFSTPLYITYASVYIVNVLLSYLLNSRYTFKSKIKLSRMIKYYLSYFFSLCFGLVLISLFERIFGFENWIYPYMVLPFTFTSNFLLSNFILKSDARLI